MGSLSLINHFQSQRDQEISKLAYYGEFFANLDLDDGYKTILYQLLIEYIGSLQNTLPPSLVATVVEDTVSRVSVALKLRTPAIQDVPRILKEVQSISTRLQKDFHMYPLIQRYPFSLHDDIALPIELQGPKESEALAWRHKIHREEAEILGHKRQLETVLQQIALLQRSSDSNMRVLYEQLRAHSPELSKKITEAEFELKNTIATGYLRNGPMPIGSSTPHVVSGFQSDAIIDMGDDGENHGISKRMLGWFAGLEDKANNIEAMFARFMQELMKFTESISTSKRIDIPQKRGLLENIKTDTDRKSLISATIVGTDARVYHQSHQIYGFELPGVTEPIQSIRIGHSRKGYPLCSFSILCNDIILQHFYTGEKGESEYIPFELDGIRKFSYIHIWDMQDTTGKPAYGYVHTLDAYRKYFYTTADGVCRSVTIDGESEFMSQDSGLEDKDHGYLIVQKKNGSQDYVYIDKGVVCLLPPEIRQREIEKIKLVGFNLMSIEIKIKDGGTIYLDRKNKDEEFVIFDIGGVREFKERKLTRDGGGIIVYPDYTESYYYESGRKILSLDGKTRFREIQTKGEYIQNSGLYRAMLVRDQPGNYRYFYTESVDNNSETVDQISTGNNGRDITLKQVTQYNLPSEGSPLVYRAFEVTLSEGSVPISEFQEIPKLHRKPYNNYEYLLQLVDGRWIVPPRMFGKYPKIITEEEAKKIKKKIGS